MISRRHKILVVDDDPDCLATIKDSLEWEGFEVISSDRGREALGLYRNDEIALVILDLNLLDVDGIQVCRRMRQGSEVPIIILSRRSTVSDRVLGLEAGADDYVTKPCDCLELCARIRAVLRRRNHVNRLPEIVIVGPFRIDTQNRAVLQNGKPVGLTKTEFELLATMARCPDEALSRRTLIRSVWGDKDLRDKSRVVDIHVKHLRAKLEDDPSQPKLIVTVPGTGYMLSVRSQPS